MTSFNLSTIHQQPLLPLLLLIILIIPNTVLCICELNVGLNKFSAFFGKGIYYNGEVNASFIENSLSQYKSSENNDIDYFYIAEKVIDFTGLDYEYIKINIEAMNQSLLNPIVKYTSHTQISREILTGEVEVVYDCKVGEVGISMLKMTFIPQSCPKFELRWLKECNSTIQLAINSIPKIDIGIQGFENILKNGVVINPNVLNITSSISTPLILKENRLVMYLSNSSPNESYTIQPIELNYPSNKDFIAQIKGGLSKGGIIPSNPTSIIFEFLCRNITIIDLEIVIPFQNNHLIKMYIREHCTNHSIASSSITTGNAVVIARKGIIKKIFAIIHAYFLLLFICLIGAVIYYNIANGNRFVNDNYFKLKRYFNEKLGHYSNNHTSPNRLFNQLEYGSNADYNNSHKEDEDSEMMNSFDEEDMINVKIQVGNNDIQFNPSCKDNTNNENLKSNQQNYGGI